MIPSDDLLSLAHRLADTAGSVVRPYFRAGVEVHGKADKSPVTVADRAAEQAIRDLIAKVAPDHGVIGEELGATNASAELCWVIDPIDGTKAFITGKPMFVTLLALLHRGEPVLGVIDQPVLRERWIGAAGRPTQLRGAPSHVRPCASLAEARLSTSGPQYFTPPAKQAFDRVAAEAQIVSYGGDGYQYGLVASGDLDIVIESGLKHHDWAALIPVITGAGGVVTDWEGHPLRADGPGQIVAAGDPRCHAEALALLASAAREEPPGAA